MKQNTVSKSMARKVASWLLRDIRLNAEAASSGHMYEPKLPQGIKAYGKCRDGIKTV